MVPSCVLLILALALPYFFIAADANSEVHQIENFSPCEVGFTVSHVLKIEWEPELGIIFKHLFYIHLFKAAFFSRFIAKRKKSCAIFVKAQHY